MLGSKLEAWKGLGAAGSRSAAGQDLASSLHALGTHCCAGLDFVICVAFCPSGMLVLPLLQTAACQQTMMPTADQYS